MKLTMLMVLTVLMMPSSAFADTMLCIAEKAVGFSWEQEQWMPKIFRTDEKYILRTATIEDKDKAIKYSVNRLTKDQVSHVWTPFGSDHNVVCSSDDRKTYCDAGIGIFTFQKLSQRFIYETGDGLPLLDRPQVHEFEKTFEFVGSLVLQIGSCSKI